MAKKDQPTGKLGHILAEYMENAVRNTLLDMTQSALTSVKKGGRTAEALRKETREVQATPPTGYPKRAEDSATSAQQCPKATSKMKRQRQEDAMWDVYRRQQQEDAMWDAYRRLQQEDAMWAAHEQSEDEGRTVQELMEGGEYDELFGSSSDAWNAEDGNDEEPEYSDIDDDEDDDGALVDGGVLDNTDLDFSSGARPISIQLNDQPNDKRNYLKRSERELLKAHPKEFGRLPEESRLETLLSEIFPDGMQKSVYIRNLSFDRTDGSEVRVLGLRPEIYDGDSLSLLLPEGHSLLFKGHLGGKTFVVDSIFETADTERLDYEVECTVIQREDPAGVPYNFLYDLQSQTQSLARYTEENLTQWQEYLDWKEEVAKRQIRGCKYFRVTVDEEKNRLVFWLICENKEQFQGFKRYLRRDVQAFEDSYSSDKWSFRLADSDSGDRKRRFNRSVELGWFGGIIRESYLNATQAQGDPDEISRSEGGVEAWVEDAAWALAETDVPFENPYIVQVAYEPNRSDADVIMERDLKGDDLTEYLYDTVLDRYDETGFLALSAVGEFVLLRRFQRAIRQLQRDEYYSPNLAAWLFNVSQARLPDADEQPEVEAWLDPRIQENENQRKAVLKMLAAPDVCLIQGPPGTGKTTVIAEAIYQFVRRGDRVLVASQSNDAVDNALERLINTPEVRAVRLGQKSHRKRKGDSAGSSRFTEDGALQRYYSALSAGISSAWLSTWAELDARAAAIEKDLRDAQFRDRDAADLRDELAGLTERAGRERGNLARCKKELDDAGKYNQRLAEEKVQFSAFRDLVATDGADEPFFLSEEQLRMMESDLNKAIRHGIDNGVYLAQGELDVMSMGAKRCNDAIRIAGHCVRALQGLAVKALEADKRQGGDDAECKVLELRYAEVTEQLLRAMDDENDDLVRQLQKRRKEIKLQIDSMGGASSAVEITATEKGFLSTELLAWLNGPERQQAVEILNEVVSQWKTAVAIAIGHVSEYMAERRKVDIAPLRDAMDACGGRLRIIQEELEDKRRQLERMNRIIAELAERYGVAADDPEAVIHRIREAQDECAAQLADRREFRSQWEPVLEGFRARLDDPDVAAYDNRFFYDTYLKSCNVVGISCTDNMRELDDVFNGFDVVIIDEVSKATPPELLIPLMKGRKAILVGDHRQLPPMFNEHEGTYKEIMEQQAENGDEAEDGEEPDDARSLLTPGNFRRFKNMVTASLFKSYFEQADDRIKHPLLVQYRMHSDISGVINRFYDNRLRNGCSPEQETAEKAHGLDIKGRDGLPLIVPKRHAYWIDSSNLPSGRPVYESFLGHSTSACNYLEIYMIIELLKKMADAHRDAWLASGKESTKSVGVISFYQMQVNELRRMWRNERRQFDFSPLSVEINTVDRFQGKEKNVIIASLVRNNKSGKASKHVISFERINVAFSRAQELLVIVGARHMYEGLQVELPNMDRPGHKTVPVYQNIMAELQRKACFKSSEKLISPELEQAIVKKCREGGEKA